MRMPFSRSNRTFAPVVLLCLALAASLAGCASKGAATNDASKTGTEAAVATPAQLSGAQTSGPTGLRRFLGVFAPYRVDVQQGNFISREMVDQLKEGMQRPEGVTREQARFVLGTPLLTDIFHADRWDYLFRLQRKNGEVMSSRVTVFFNNNRVTRIDGDTLPTEQEYLAFISGSAPGATASAATK